MQYFVNYFVNALQLCFTGQTKFSKAIHSSSNFILILSNSFYIYSPVPTGNPIIITPSLVIMHFSTSFSTTPSKPMTFSLLVAAIVFKDSKPSEVIRQKVAVSFFLVELPINFINLLNNDIKVLNQKLRISKKGKSYAYCN